MIEWKLLPGSTSSSPAGHLGISSWITLSGPDGYKRSTVVEWSPSTHLIVDILRYNLKRPSVGFRLGTVLVRVRRSLHTMLLTISNSKPISTGRFVANCLLAGISDGCRSRLLKRCWSINTCSHFIITSFEIMIIIWASFMLPQLWCWRSWSWKVWACHYKDDHVTWRRCHSRMTLRLTF